MKISKLKSLSSAISESESINTHISKFHKSFDKNKGRLCSDSRFFVSKSRRPDLNRGPTDYELFPVILERFHSDIKSLRTTPHFECLNAPYPRPLCCAFFHSKELAQRLSRIIFGLLNSFPSF
jgi:hypothetical protein